MSMVLMIAGMGRLAPYEKRVIELLRPIVLHVRKKEKKNLVRLGDRRNGLTFSA